MARVEALRPSRSAGDIGRRPSPVTSPLGAMVSPTPTVDGGRVTGAGSGEIDAVVTSVSTDTASVSTLGASPCSHGLTASSVSPIGPAPK